MDIMSRYDINIVYYRYWEHRDRMSSWNTIEVHRNGIETSEQI